MPRRVVVIAAGGILSLLILFELIPWRCPFGLFTGLPCPTCGFVRAARAALHGDFARAFHLHPLWPAIVIVVGAIAVAESVSFVRNGALGAYPGRRTLMRVAFALAVVVFVVWIARFFGALGGPVALGGSDV